MSMLQDIRALHAEVTQFRHKLKELSEVQVQNISAIARRVNKELENLESAEPHGEIMSSTNTSDLVRIWRLARSLPALSGFFLSFRSDRRLKEDTVMVDIVYRKGHAWINRVSLKYRALISEITNLTFTAALPTGSVPGLPHEISNISLDSDVTDDLQLFSAANLNQLRVVDVVRKLVTAANDNHKLGARPSVTLYFSRILEECRKEEDLRNIQALFDHLGRYEVACITEIDAPLSFEFNVGTQLKDDFGNEALSLAIAEPVQLDLTTLFVLCSDISNVPLSNLVGTHQALQFQIQEEFTVPCLRERIFPIIRNSRPLVCTPLARRRFFEIVTELGSTYEKERANLMFSSQPAEMSCQQLSHLSIHEWPVDIQFPIVAHTFGQKTYSDAMTMPVGFKTTIAQHCFENAWYGRIFTLSANQQAVKTFREALFTWSDTVFPKPRVHLHAARSLTMYERPAMKIHADIMQC